MATVRGGIPTGGYAGKFGNAVFYERDGQLHMRELVLGTNPRTPDQQAGRRGFGGVAKGWKGIPDEAAEAWDARGRAEGTTGYLLYMSLTRRWLRVHPGGTPPAWPPAGPFFGDAVTLRIGVAAEDSPSPDGSFGRGGRGERSGTPSPLPRPPLQDEPLGEVALTLTASQPNAAGVVTEILVQPLANARRKPRARDWKTAAFLTFAAGSLTQGVALPKGAYAVAYKFVAAATGQATAMATLGATTAG